MQAYEVKMLKKYTACGVNKLWSYQAIPHSVFTILFPFSKKLQDSKEAINVVCIFLIAMFGLASCGGSIESYTPIAGSSEVQLTPSRISGVAPLSVFFDATGTTDAGTSRPFHDLEYRWDFGDTAGSPVNGTTWGTGSQLTPTCSAPYNGCRNNATGAVGAHVYETAGTYTVTLNVLNGTSTKAKTTTITVTDPSTLTTACVAHGVTPTAGDTNGCPATATLFYNQISFDTALSTAIAAGAKRILFRKGDTFTSAASNTISAAGPGIVGAYGTGANPVITVGVIAQYATTLSMATSDWRIMDLTINAPGSVNQNAIAASNRSQLTVLRVATTSFNYAVNATTIDQLTVADCNFTVGGVGSTGSNYGIWLATSTTTMLLGNSMYINTINSHNIRLQGVSKFVVANSTQTGSDRIEPITIRGNTQYGVLSDNKFVDYIVTVKPQNSGSNEYQRDLIFERNWFVAGSFSGPSLNLEGSGTTVRNNIFDLSLGGLTAITTVYNSTAGAPMPNLINIYNNTIYSSVANNGNLSAFRSITYYSLDTSCHSEVKNNLVYSPNTYNLAPVLIYSTAACVITGTAGTSGNSSDSQIKNTSPSFASATPSNPADFIIGTGSYAHNTGVALPIFSDFFRRDTLTGGFSSSSATLAP
jgi:PKD repeat protein